MGALFDMPWTPMFLGVLFLLHPLLGAVGIVSAGLLIAAALLQAWSSAGLQVEAAQAQSRADGWWRASADNVERTAAAGIAPVVSSRWADFAVKAASIAYAAAARGYLIKALAKAIRLLSQIAIFGAGALVVINHEASPGILVAGSILMGRALAPIEQSLTLLRLYVIARRSARGLKVLVMPAVRGLGSNDAPPKGIVSVKDAAYAYPGRSVLALRGVSLDVQPGEVIGIIGPNGAGKSTLAALLAGVMEPRSGSVELDGVPMTEWQRTARKACVGYLPQRSILFAGTVQENIVRFGDDGLLTASQAGMRAGVHEIISDLPQGYQTIVADDGVNLAPHETRAIELARAVQKPVRLAILDEPDAGLDGVSERRLMRVLAELKAEGITLVIATQQPRLLAIADRVVVLNHGMIEMQGPAREVLRQLAQSRGANPAPSSLPAPKDTATAPAPQVVRAVS
jgi:ABC-type protease/lipase transport system fused ATPase/permease subunit